MFLRRLFYDLATGEKLISYWQSGSISPNTIEWDVTFYNLTNYGVFEWLTPDPEIEQAFADSHGRVAVNLETQELVFDFSPLPEPEPLPDYEAYYEAMSAEIERGE